MRIDPIGNDYLNRPEAAAVEGYIAPRQSSEEVEDGGAGHSQRGIEGCLSYGTAPFPVKSITPLTLSGGLFPPVIVTVALMGVPSSR